MGEFFVWRADDIRPYDGYREKSAGAGITRPSKMRRNTANQAKRDVSPMLTHPLRKYFLQIRGICRTNSLPVPV